MWEQGASFLAYHITISNFQHSWQVRIRPSLFRILPFMFRLPLSHTMDPGAPSAENRIIDSKVVQKMGEWTEFNAGDRAPNEGAYIEVGENDYHMGINNPKKIHLHKGEKFPDTSNK